MVCSCIVVRKMIAFVPLRNTICYNSARTYICRRHLQPVPPPMLENQRYPMAYSPIKYFTIHLSLGASLSLYRQQQFNYWNYALNTAINFADNYGIWQAGKWVCVLVCGCVRLVNRGLFVRLPGPEAPHILVRSCLSWYLLSRSPLTKGPFYPVLSFSHLNHEHEFSWCYSTNRFPTKNHTKFCSFGQDSIWYSHILGYVHYSTMKERVRSEAHFHVSKEPEKTQ